MKIKEGIREQLIAKLPTADAMYEELQRVDPEFAKIVHRNSKGRVLRALEIYYATGKRKSEILAEQKSRINDGKDLGKLRSKRTLLINLDAEKELLTKRLEERVDKMIEHGLLSELDDFYRNVSRNRSKLPNAMKYALDLE
jgi:tRNA dimethylallyltransferase